MKFRVLASVLAFTFACGTALAQPATVEEVDCSQVNDPKKNGRSGKSYFTIATKSDPFDEEVLRKAEVQFAMALCEENGIPDQWEWNMFMGMIKCEFGKHGEAGPYFERATQNAEKKKHKEQVADNRKHYWVDRYNSGLNAFKEEAYESAATEARAALEIDPTECRGYTLLGPALIQTAQFDEAISVLEKGRELCEEDDRLRENLFVAYHNHGGGLFNDKKYAEAAEWYAKAAELNPEDLGNLYQLGASQLQAAEEDSTMVGAARQSFQRYIELVGDEGRADGLYNLTLVDLEAEDYEAAEVSAGEYISARPFDPDGYRLMSRIYAKTKQSDKMESNIVLFNCMKTEPIEDVGSWCADAAKRYGARSDFAKAMKDSGDPDRVYLHTDSNGNEMVATYYESAGELHSFYHGKKKGTVTATATVAQDN